jgi:hypothetical protein
MELTRRGRAVVVACAMLAGAACSGGKAKTVEDARKQPHHDAAVGQGQTQGSNAGNGDVQVRVEWKNVPAAVRGSPGRTPCGTARAAAVSPTTTWGIPDVFVTIDFDNKAAPEGTTRLVLDPCALVPRVALAGTTLAIASAADAPAKLGITKVGQLPFGGAALGTPPKPLYLPIGGHEVEVGLDARGIYLVQIENPGGQGFDVESAWVVSSDTPYVAITESNGQVTLRDLPVGTYAVHAWLPARGGQDQRIAHGTVTVAAGDLAEVTLNLAP